LLRGDLAYFLSKLSDQSCRPRSILHSAQAAIGHLYKALHMHNVVSDTSIFVLVTSLIKSGSSCSMKRSTVMPTSNFTVMFMNWDNNADLSIKDLRLKLITLMSLCLMLRPSDIASRAVHYNTGAQNQRIIFSTDQVVFLDNGAAKIMLFGIMNDSQRNGFEVIMQPHSYHKLCPVRALQVYLFRTPCIRTCIPHNPIFLTL
jgi:hypothetical protein